MKTRTLTIASSLNRALLSAAFVAAFAFASRAPAADAPFAGRVDMTMTQVAKKSNVTSTMTYYIKDTKMRVEIAPKPDAKSKNKDDEAAISAVTLMDTAKNEAAILMPAQKMYFTMDLSGKTNAPASATQRRANFTPTGRTEVIAGIAAEEYVSDPDPKTKEISEVWITSELGKFIMANKDAKPNGKAPEKNAWQQFIEDKGAFVMRVIQRKKAGAPENYRMEVTNVERMTPADSLFAIPEDYKKFEMPKLGDMFKGLMKN